MATIFSNVIEDIKKLSLEEKETLRFLLERYLVEERRSEIQKNYENSQKELRENQITFSSDIESLKDQINQ